MNAERETDPRIAIIGTGFGGLCMAIRLKQAGIDTFTLFEKQNRIGGTWRDNTYPGAACDVESHLYSFSFAPKADWSRKFGDQAEILAYLEACVAHYGLAPHIRLGVEITAADYDAAGGRWRLTATDGAYHDANVLVTACGQLNRPARPDMPGQADFAGPAFHSARWRHDVDTAGRRVAVIGTGASAIQFVPRLAESAVRLSIFQRSGAWVIPKPDRAFSRREQRRFARWPGLARCYRGLIYGKNEARALAFTRWRWILQAFAWTARRQARRQMCDEDKRRRLAPDYSIGCKRILMANDWYPAIDRDHVDLVTAPIARIEADAVVTDDGRRHPADVLIYATGFHATDFLAPMRITGTGGRELAAAWREGASAYKGVAVAGFPNMFLLYGPNTNLAHNSIVYMLEAQVDYVMQCVQALRDPALRSMDVRPEREAGYTHRIRSRLEDTVWAGDCGSWYRTAAGHQTNNWPGFTFTFRRMTARLDRNDYRFETASAADR